jgi:hypothetical protein
VSGLHTPGPRPTDFPDRAPDGYVWVIAELVKDRFCPSGYLRTRPTLGRFWLHSEARKSIHARRDAHSMTLVPVLIENFPVVLEDA